MRLLIIFLMAIFMTNPSFAAEKTERAVFAGGCFWCMEPVFDSADGVISTKVGYSGGATVSPSYEQISTDKTGHYEAIEVVFDPAKTNFEDLVRIYFANIDPFDETGQFADKGSRYQTVIFYGSENQKKIAEKVKADVQKKFPDKKVAVKILPTSDFYKAEEYHQDYYKKNPIRYEMYKEGSGRASGVKRIWGDASK